MTRTQISLPLPPLHGGPRYETLWAEPVGRARYRLLNCSFFLPLAVGDVVKALRRGGRVVVTDFVEAGERTLSCTTVAHTVSEEEQRAVTEGWRRGGAAWTEGSHRLLLTVWRPDVNADDAFAFLVDDVRGRRGWHVPAVYSPQDRTRIMRAHFAPEPEPSNVVISLDAHRARRGATPRPRIRNAAR
ncbi:MAG: DUF4265 domain-containing protein [Mobilicoccus sp.]|nr:DUF4265 domain-containing protein [Mobilicoccus sp.]